MHRHSLALAATLIVVAAIAACSATTDVLPADGLLPLGTYGGDSVGLIVSDTAMHLHIACTFGDVSGRVRVDATGAFDVAGSYVLRAYPIAVGPSLPARFVGRLSGTSVVVTVTVNDTVLHATVVRGPAVATLGQAPRDLPCPICRRPVITRLRQWVSRLFSYAR